MRVMQRLIQPCIVEIINGTIIFMCVHKPRRTGDAIELLSATSPRGYAQNLTPEKARANHLYYPQLLVGDKRGHRIV